MKKIYYYPTCGTCKKALKWLDENKVKYEKKHIVEETPNIEELMEIYKKSNLELKKFFNTSGNVYKEMNLKDFGEIKKKKATEKVSCTSINSGFYLKIIPVKLAVFDMKKGVL